MKIIPTLLLGVFLITGCSDNTPVGKLYEDGTYDPPDQLKIGLKYNDVYAASKAGTLYRIEFDGHIYVVLSGQTYYMGGMTHDPDCPCSKKKPLEKE